MTIMKKLGIFLSLAILSLTSMRAQTLFTLAPDYQSPQREVRAMWLTTLQGLDWPYKAARTPAETEVQKQTLCQILDQLQAAGINTVLFQTRIRSTTSYPSAIEPWDAVYTDTPGKAPLYDPLQFALDECHKRQMELHAWVVAFPICKTNVQKALGRKSLPSLHPELCQRCGDQWMMDPGVPGTADYIAGICEEIVKNYQVDGIHLDYIRYPEQGIPFNDNRTYRKYGKGKNKAEWRRENVTRVVQKIHDAVKGVRPWVKISCSPVGKHADLRQQSSYGWNARNAVYQDAQAWLRDGLMDILFPMMYFDGKHFYPFAADWQDNAHGRWIVPGLGIYFLHERQKDWDLDIIRRQMFFSRQIGAAGQAQFRSKFFTDNVKGLYDFAAGDFYREKVRTPAMTWEDSIAPTGPAAQIEVQRHNLYLHWRAARDNAPATPVTYNVYYCPNDSLDVRQSELLAYGIQDTTYVLTPALPARLRGYYAVTASDAYGNESSGKAVSAYTQIAATIASSGEDNILAIPEVEGAEFLLVTDITERHVFTTPYASKIDVSRLAPGYYEVRTLSKKGKSHRVLRFWKE